MKIINIHMMLMMIIITSSSLSTTIKFPNVLSNLISSRPQRLLYFGTSCSTYFMTDRSKCNYLISH